MNPLRFSIRSLFIAILALSGLGRAQAATLTATPASGPAPLTVNFKAASFTGATQYDWDFGDGPAVKLKTNTVTHKYIAAGNYQVTVTGYNATLNKIVKKINISVGAAPAKLTATPVSGPAPLTVAFTAENFTGATQYDFNFGDGPAVKLFTNTATHKYAVAGNYQATVTSYNSASTKITKTVDISVGAAPPALTAVPATGKAPLKVAFTAANFTGATQYDFDFGAGPAVKLFTNTASFTYSTPGTYQATVTSYDMGGNKISKTIDIIVNQ